MYLCMTVLYNTWVGCRGRYAKNAAVLSLTASGQKQIDNKNVGWTKLTILQHTAAIQNYNRSLLTIEFETTNRPIIKPFSCQLFDR